MHLREMFGVRIKSVAFSCSLLLACVASAQDATHLAASVDQAKSAGEAAQIVLGSPSSMANPDVAKAVEAAQKNPASAADLAQLQATMDVQARIQSSSVNPATASQAAAIVSGSLYQGGTVRAGSNWVGTTFAKLAKLIPKFRDGKVSPTMNGPTNLDWVVPVMWTLLGTVAVALICYGASIFVFKMRLRRRTAAVLEDDEPERTLDEWLAMADQLEAAGKYREAIRCLYLACLIRFDEAGVARFIKSETNWEHLRRIQASEKNRGIDFLPLTLLFDLAWYGYRAKSANDVTDFRAGYQAVVQGLTKAAA